jgi:nucleoside 2-deoxyribosyltransferase
MACAFRRSASLFLPGANLKEHFSCGVVVGKTRARERVGGRFCLSAILSLAERPPHPTLSPHAGRGETKDRFAGHDEKNPVRRYGPRNDDDAEKTMTKLYLAGPLFTLAEQQFNADLARFLEAEGFDVWLPQEHEPRGDTAKAIFDMDVEAIDWADMVVACMDGPDPDSGTAWECGYAFGKGKPVVCYRTDFRISGDTKDAPYNLMLSESATTRFEVPFRTKTPEFHKRVLERIRKALQATRAKNAPPG